jgi:Trypsin-like serine proteases, typically periplasmic, contain C-terminal PDZ domain
VQIHRAATKKKLYSGSSRKEIFIMENNNWNENNVNNNNNMNTSSTENNTNGTAYTAESGGASASQPESGSTYGYSYLNQEQKNPNNIWRADENTTGAYTGSSYNSAQSGTSNGYGTYSNPQSDQTNGGAYTAQSDTANGNAYGSTQQDYANNYSNIYGKANHQSAGWNTYSDAKQQKKAERAQRRAAKKAEAGTNANSNFGVKLAKCASFALIFGLVAGTAFEGSSYVAGSLFGTKDKEVSAVPDTGSSEDALKIGEDTQTSAPLTATASSTGDGVVSIVEQCMPSIVAITNMSQVQYQNWFGQVQKYEVPSAGSGIIVGENKDYLYIATNNHVVESATTLTIRFSDDTTASAEIKGTDVSTDLAVIQVKKADIDSGTLSKIKVATLGDSSEIKVGSQAIAIGNALGYGQSVTAGYISALEREVTTQDENSGNSYTNKLIQTDAAINPGNSGGALLNKNGEVIGINSSKYNDTAVEGMGFAIPSNTAKPIIEDLITKEQVSDDKAAYLGIHGENVTAAVTEAYNMPEGVFVKEVFKGTAAEQYGIKAGDIITSLDGRDIATMEVLHTRLSYYEAGSQVEIIVQRPMQNGYEEVKLSVVLGKKN